MHKQKASTLFIGLLSFLFLQSAVANITPRIIGGEESAKNEWPFMTALMYKESGITVSDQTFSAAYLQGVPTKNFSGVLADCGPAFDTCANVSGKVCLIKRGTNTFEEKIRNCRKGGGIAAIIFNHDPGIFFGLANNSIPAVSVSKDTGGALFSFIDHNVRFGFLDEIPTRSFCGGSYIGGRWVLTAAHCVENVTADSIILNIGGQNLETDQENIFNVRDIAIHRDHPLDIDSVFSDIAVIELSTEPEGITPVELADETLLSLAIENNAKVSAIGRGLKTPLGLDITEGSLEPPDPALYDVELSLEESETCNQIMDDYVAANIDQSEFHSKLVTDDMLCAGNIEGGVGSCKGDSGGPLILKAADKNYLVGITSWGFGCAQADVYGVYTRVPFFKNSINSVLEDNLQVTFLSTANRNNGEIITDEDDSGGNLHPGLLFMGLIYLLAFRRFHKK